MHRKIIVKGDGKEKRRRWEKEAMKKESKALSYNI